MKNTTVCRKCGSNDKECYTINDSEYKYKIRCPKCGFSVVANTKTNVWKYWDILCKGAANEG